MFNDQQRLRLFERAVAESSDAVVFIGSDGAFRYANRTACELLGYREQELIGMTVSQINPDYPLDRWSEHWEETRRHRRYTFTSTHRRRDGSSYPCEIRKTFIPAEQSGFDRDAEDLIVATFRDVSDELERESSLAASGRLIDESVNEVYIFDAETLRFLYINQGALANLGYSTEEALRLTPVDLKHEHTEKSFRGILAPLLSGEVEKTLFSATHTRKDGTRYDVDVRLQTGDYRGRRCLVALILDVTPQRQAERALKASEQRARSSESLFRAVIESAPTAILMVDPAGIIVLANDRTEEIFGYATDELVGQSVEVLVPEPLRGGHGDLVRGFFAQPEQRRIGEGRQLHGLRKDGQQTPVEIVLQPVTTPQGRFVLAAVSDLTKRLADQQALHASELRYRTLFEFSPVMNANLDPASLAIIDCNERLVRQLGYRDKDEVVGRSVLEVCSEDCREEIAELLATPGAEASNPTLDAPLLNADGTQIPAALSLTGVRNDSGELVLYAVSWVDITDLKRYTRELEHANRDMEEFTYVASHDLRAPLRAVDHLACWIEEDLGEAISPDSRRHLDQLKQRVQRMETLLDDLRRYARVGRDHTEPEDIDLLALVNSVTETVGTPPALAIQTDIRFRHLVGQRIPLETVMRNLIANAIKHHDGDQVEVAVVTRPCPTDAGMVEFVVEDNGPGIPTEMRGRVFGVFQTLRPRDELEGSGMGLPLVKKHVNNAGGRVWIEANQPRGLSVHFTWPAVPEGREVLR